MSPVQTVTYVLGIKCYPCSRLHNGVLALTLASQASGDAILTSNLSPLEVAKKSLANHAFRFRLHRL